MNVSNNHLTSISLKELDHLKYLDMSYNKLTNFLDNQFAFMGTIQMINASQNRLNSIQPFTFADLVSLNTLDLSSNRLHTDDFLASAARINSIDLRNNAYEQIDLAALNSIERIFLAKNPWNCTWLLNAMANLDHVNTDIRFGLEVFDGAQNENRTTTTTSTSIEELECVDYRKSIDRPSVRRVFVINFHQCTRQKSSENQQKVSVYDFEKVLDN